MQTREEFEKVVKSFPDSPDVQQACRELVMAEEAHTQLVDEVS